MLHGVFMRRCIELASNGLGKTYPNPLVGSVLVHNGMIIGEGWHQKAGLPHAEVNAIASVSNKKLLSESTIYVSLEPCSHHGKTPPCTDLIIEKKIPKVVVGTVDPFAKVNGSGIEKLRKAGCEVIVGVLEKECQQLNKRFFTFHQKKRPYILLKWATTSDGYTAPLHKEGGRPCWITNIYARQYAHKLRSIEQAILVGCRTAIDDNPQLNTRLWYGTDPIRIVVDPHLRTPRSYALWNQTQPTLFLSNVEQGRKEGKNTEIIPIDFSENLPKQVSQILYERNIQSLIVEGGTMVQQQFIDANCWDEAHVMIGKVTFGNGLKAPSLQNFEKIQQKDLVGDNLLVFKNPSQ